MSLMHCVISFMEFLSTWEFCLRPLALFFWYAKVGEFILVITIHPICLLDEQVVHLWYFESCSEDWILCFEMNFVCENICQFQVIFNHAQCIVVFLDNADVLLFELIWHSVMASLSYVLSGQSLLFHFWKSVLYVLGY